jgi:two-component system heavy metal sensor histidine kinase CusS
MNSAPPAKPPRPWSMTIRLIGLQVLVVALLIGGALYFLLRTVTDHLEIDDRGIVDQQATLLRNWFEDPNTDAAAIIKQLSALFSGPVTDQFFFVRILGPYGNVWYDAGNSAAPPADAFPVPGQPAVYWHVTNGPHFLMTSVWATVGTNRQKVQLQLAFDVTDDFTLTRQIRQSITVVFAVALLASAGLAFGITRNALRPLRALTKSAARVQASQLNARLDETVWPVELTPLVREFDAMLGRLDGSFRRLARFSSDLSHELRTPINNLRGEAEVALNRPRSVEEYRTVLESSLEEYDRITRLIDTLLFIAKADQPESGLKRQQLDGAAECRAVADFFEASSAERELTLIVRGQASIYCDPMLFRRALSNLVDNALRHTPKGGHVDLTVRVTAAGGTEVEVSDSGTGITAEHLPHVFERFYQAEKETTDSTARVSGFGLGLAIVKSIMELHGGKVDISSTPDRGTTISLYFPGYVSAATS